MPMSSAFQIWLTGHGTDFKEWFMSKQIAMHLEWVTFKLTAKGRNHLSRLLFSARFVQKLCFPFKALLFSLSRLIHPCFEQQSIILWEIQLLRCKNFSTWWNCAKNCRIDLFWIKINFEINFKTFQAFHIWTLLSCGLWHSLRISRC